MICAGCGDDLPAGAGRGRPARFHGPTCRQRARRARLASRNADALAAVAAVESAASELRRVLLAHGDAREAGQRLAQCVTAVQRLLPVAVPVTEPVTTRTPADHAEFAHLSAVSPPGQAPDAVTKAVTEKSSRRPGRGRRRPVPLDLETVRVERNTEPTGATWRVLAGDTDEPVLIGYVEAARTATGGRASGRWTAITPLLMPLRRRARNRTEAVAVLVETCLRGGA